MSTVPLAGIKARAKKHLSGGEWGIKVNEASTAHPGGRSLSIVDREHGAAELFQRAGIPFTFLFRAGEFMK
jgi:hypothetical protein